MKLKTIFLILIDFDFAYIKQTFRITTLRWVRIKWKDQAKWVMLGGSAFSSWVYTDTEHTGT